MKQAIYAIFIVGLAGQAQAQDVANGERTFRRCAACHMIGDDASNRVGPVLTGVVGRPAASFEGYDYSPSMTAAAASGLTWTEDFIFEYLADPTAFLRTYLDDPRARAKMTFRIRDEQERRDVAAYLATFSPAEQASNDAGICVENGSEQTFLFAAEARGGERDVAELTPGGSLCVASQGADSGVVSVFESMDVVEGCSRLVTPGQQEVLVRYADFDRCEWGSHS
jgi:cytochrome c2